MNGNNVGPEEAVKGVVEGASVKAGEAGRQAEQS